MSFSNKLYELRKQKGLSQEELADKLNVSRQTVSKWEIGDSTPEMEKLIAISDLFEVSLDSLVLGKEQLNQKDNEHDYSKIFNEKILTADNKRRAKKVIRVGFIILGILVFVDILSMIIYFIVNGIPK